MQAIWVLAVLALASADVSHLGYHYNVPQTSYGIPSYQVGDHSGYYQYGAGHSGASIYKGAEGQYLGSTFSHGDHSGLSHLSGDGHLSTGFLNGGIASGLGHGVNSGSNAGYYSGYNNGYGSGYNGYTSGLSGSGLSSGQYFQTQGVSSTVKPIYLGGSNQYQTSQYNSGEKHYQQYYQVQSNEPTQVYKHFYVHSAPEEPELPKPRTPIVLPPPQKHYKIIFVKTPTASSYSSQIVPVQPQSEEKTIVYVLVKKPEEHSEVIVPKVEQKPPTKPDVYFIKYNNKEDSQAVINNIVNDYNKPGQSVSYVSGGSEGSSVVSGLPSLSGESGYVSGSSGLSDISTSNFASIPSGGFSNGFSKYPSSTSFPSSSFGTSFSHPSSVVSTLSDASQSSGTSFSDSGNLSTGGSTITSIPSDSLFNKFGSSSSGTVSEISSGSSLFGSSQSDSSLSVPLVSSSGSSQSLGVSTSGASESSNSGAEASSLFSGVSSPSVITTTSGQNDLTSVSGTQGLPHENYGVPNFRIR